MAEDLWNTRDPALVATAYSLASRWRNRNEVVTGRTEIQDFLIRKWAKERDYRLIKELWGFRLDRMAVRFAYEWHDQGGDWYRSYGVELWQFAPDDLVTARHASINDLRIPEEQRLFRWPAGRRPSDHAGLTELGL